MGSRSFSIVPYDRMLLIIHFFPFIAIRLSFIFQYTVKYTLFICLSISLFSNHALIHQSLQAKYQNKINHDYFRLFKILQSKKCHAHLHGEKYIVLKFQRWGRESQNNDAKELVTVMQ